MQKDNLEYARSFNVQYGNSDPFTGKRLVEPYSDHEFVVQNPPSKPLTTSEMDAVYRLPYARAYHPMYEEAGGIPAIREVKFSLTSNRGCFGECAFCALTFHQGRIVQVRSHESVSYTHLQACELGHGALAIAAVTSCTKMCIRDRAKSIQCNTCYVLLEQ